MALYTTSGEHAVDFTNDRDLLIKELRGVRSGVKSTLECPQIGFYLANQVLNKNDDRALDMLVAELSACHAGQRYAREEAEYMVKSAARRALSEGDWNARQALASMRAVVGKLATAPGQRSLVLVSDGFLVLDQNRGEEMNLMEQAVRSGVVVNGLDARGLKAYVPGGDASVGGSVSIEASLLHVQYDKADSDASAAVLAEAASGTGGRYFGGSNAVDEGMARIAGTPDYVYVLGFSPQNLKYDGRYHTLKVTLRNPKGLTVEARRGYFAPNREIDPAEQSKEEIQAAFFSTEELREVPAEMEAQFFKTGDGATVDILARVDVKKLNFRREADRNRNDVTIVSGLFDDNGNYVSGIQKILEMRLKDDTLETRLANGIAVRTSIENVKPGRYAVRMVVRDSEGQAITALSGAVEIP